MKIRFGRTNIKSNRTLGLKSLMGAVFCLCLVFGVSLAADSPENVHQYTLSEKIEAAVSDDGSITISSDALKGLLLQGNLDPLTDTRRRRGSSSAPQSKAFLVKEGQLGGHRGFSGNADDDADGLVDEDILDGLDNDGDGLIDEDYAAISDAMTVVHLSQGAGLAQLDFMHWNGPRLQGALFLNFTAKHELSGVTTPYYHLESAGDSWREIDVLSRNHDLAGRSNVSRATAFVVRMVNHGSSGRQSVPSALSPIGPEAITWVGVLVLDQSPKTSDLGLMRPKLEDRILSLPLSDEPRATVICTASSWLQLNRLLLDAMEVYQGVTDPVNNQQANWIVSPLCSHCRLEKTIDLTISQNQENSLSLQFALEPGLSGLMDPDLFVLGGQPLGSPSEVTWMPLNGPKETVFWDLVTPEKLGRQPASQSDLYGLLGEVSQHNAHGKLIFKFTNPAEKDRTWLEAGITLNLDGTWLDGRGFTVPGAVVAPEVEPVPEKTEISNQDQLHSKKHRLSLSASLLEGWPNPFQEQIQIKFVVPSSVQDAFEWSDEKPLPDGLDLSSPVDWSAGEPSVSVKVYSINGQELVSLQQGTLGQGQYTVTWNGTDSFGRKVASGTYFCKLQMDRWSTTRRLVFLR